MDQWVELVTSHQKGSWFSSQLEQSPSVRRLDLDLDAVGWLPNAPRGWVEWRGLVSLQYGILCDEDISWSKQVVQVRNEQFLLPQQVLQQRRHSIKPAHSLKNSYRTKEVKTHVLAYHSCAGPLSPHCCGFTELHLHEISDQFCVQ